MRKLMLAVVASATFGGTIGALATAAFQSQASPAAIAAAVQRVQDQSAEQSLGIVSRNLDAGGFGFAARNLSALRSMENQLRAICENTRSGNPSGGFCPSQ